MQIITAESSDPRSPTSCLVSEVNLKCFHQWTHSLRLSALTLNIPIVTFVSAPHALLQITFLEFFEVLLGCAEVKCPQVSDAPEVGDLLSSPDVTNQMALAEMEASEKTLQPTDTSQPVRSSPSFSETGAPLNKPCNVVLAHQH